MLLYAKDTENCCRSYKCLKCLVMCEQCFTFYELACSPSYQQLTFLLLQYTAFPFTEVTLLALPSHFTGLNYQYINISLKIISVCVWMFDILY